MCRPVFLAKAIDVLLAAWAQGFRPTAIGSGWSSRAFPIRTTTLNNRLDARRQDASGPWRRSTYVNREMSRDALRRTLTASADAMVLPTRGEGFNIPAAEAMAAGLPLADHRRGRRHGFLRRGQCHPDRLSRMRSLPQPSALAFVAMDGARPGRPRPENARPCPGWTPSGTPRPKGRRPNEPQLGTTAAARRAAAVLADPDRLGRSASPKASLDIFLAPPARRPPVLPGSRRGTCAAGWPSIPAICSTP